MSGTVTPIGLAFWAILLIGRMSQAIADADLKIDVVSLGARTSNPGAPANFTGAVQVEQLFAAQSGRGVSGGKVTFEPGARSFWHTHPKGQTLIVTAGVGLIQQWGGAVRSIKTGDVVWIPPGIKHWHGAAPNTPMAHFAIQEALDGKVVDWMEPVSDAQYLSGAAKARSQSNCYFGDSMLTQSDVGQVSPALAAFTQEKLFGEVWKRGNLSLRDRSMVTLAALIARNQTMQLHYYLNLALDSGVKPGEISEIIFHLAFYSGWENAIAATVSAKEVFDKRGIHADSLPPASVPSLPLNEAAEKQRATTVEQNFGAVAPGVVQYTTDLLFRDLWLRPALAPRDRSLVTVSALMASGQVAQVTYHLNRAMDNGLTQTQAAEVLTHLAFLCRLAQRLLRAPCSQRGFCKARVLKHEEFNMTLDFENKVALVTGAASGLGLATARAFARCGASVVLADWHENEVQSAAEELASEGYKTLAVCCDVSDDTQVEALVRDTLSAFGRLDAAYNNAGVQNLLAETADTTREDYDRVMGVNLRGVWSSMKFELQVMRKQGSGAIVNCSSLGGLVGGAQRGIYHAAKHGVLGVTKSAALEYAARGIRINAICPGLIQTPMSDQMVAAGQGDALKALEEMIPMARVGRPEEIANAVLWLCSDAASYVTGQSISVDGGFTMR